MLTVTQIDSKDLRSVQTLTTKVNKIQDFDVHLWTINRNLYNNQLSYADYLLDNAEQMRAQRFRFRKDHDLFVVGRYITKVLMSYYTDFPLHQVKIFADAFGKPVSNVDLYFNISHSDEQLLLGFSNSSIGVDIERENPLMDTESVGKSHFSKTEFQVLRNASLHKKLATFFGIWTKKESLIKGIGKGLSMELTDFSVLAQDGKIDWDLPSENIYGDWYVREIKIEQRYTSAFSTQNPNINFRCYCVNN